MVRLGGIEPTPLAPEANALSTGLQAHLLHEQEVLYHEGLPLSSKIP